MPEVFYGSRSQNLPPSEIRFQGLLEKYPYPETLGEEEIEEWKQLYEQRKGEGATDEVSETCRRKIEPHAGGVELILRISFASIHQSYQCSSRYAGGTGNILQHLPAEEADMHACLIRHNLFQDEPTFIKGEAIQRRKNIYKKNEEACTTRWTFEEGVS